MTCRVTAHGGYSIFFRIRRLGPSIYRSPPKISGISSTPKIFGILATKKKISQCCTLTLKKTLKCIEMSLELAQFCDDPKKYPQNLHTPQKYSFFWKPQKILKFRLLNTQKKSEPTYVWKYQCTPPPPWGWQLFMQEEIKCETSGSFIRHSNLIGQL